MREQDIKLDLIQWIAETADMDSIRKIQAIRDASATLTPEQEAILKVRIEKYENGQMNFTPWNKVRERILKK